MEENMDESQSQKDGKKEEDPNIPAYHVTYHWKAQDVLFTIHQGLIEYLKRVKGDACGQNIHYRGHMSTGWVSGGNTGCKECCERCVGSLPWASLIATILLYMGVALFCGCGHEALSGTVTILQNYFEVIRAPGETLDVFTIIDILKYIIYGLAAGFFVFGVLLLVEGFFTTGAIRDLYGEFKITACGRCLTAFLMFLAYLFFLVWLGVTAFTSLPVFMYFNVWSMCQNTSLVEGANLCLDLRQFGAVTISEERKVCTGSEKFFKMCESNELDLTFHLFVCTLAGAGAAVIAMVHFLMALAANWGYLKDASRIQKYEDIKSKEEQELHDIHSTRSKERLNAYT